MRRAPRARDRAARRPRRHAVGRGAGRAWAHGRFQAPYLRDSLLDVGVLVETLETATFWSGAGGLYAAVKAALTRVGAGGTPPLVLCHISHVYETGRSLYFTVAAPAGGRPARAVAGAKAAASDAIVAAGATITHHHAVGTDHRPWLAAEIGPVGVRILRAVKARARPDRRAQPRRTDRLVAGHYEQAAVKVKSLRKTHWSPPLVALQ